MTDGAHNPTTTRALLAAIEQMEEGVIVTDTAGAILFVNAAAARMHGTRVLGISADQYSPTYNLLTPDGQPYPSEALPLARAVLRGETVTNEQWRIRRPDGTEISALGCARPVYDDNGNRIGAVLTMTDNTARETAERLERERNALARQIHEAFAQSPRSTVLYDATGKPLAVNQAFERLWGASLSDVPADYSVLNDPQLIAAGIMPQLRRAFGLDGARSPEGAGEAVLLPPLPYEMGAAAGKGSTLWTQAHVYPVRDAAGNIDRVVLTHYDVTAARAADVARSQTMALQALTEALSQSSTTREMATAIVAHSPAVLGSDDVVIVRSSADNKTLELLEVVGMPADIRLAWSSFPVDAPVPIAEVARTGEPLYLQSRDELAERYPALMASFEETGHQANVVLPLIVNDKLFGVLGAAFDTPNSFDDDYKAMALTLARLCAQALDRARLFEAERIARESAEQANRAKGEFLAIMSHELRTPLNAIGGYAEIMEMGIRGPVTDEQRTDLQRIQRSQLHLLGLVNGVLNYSRVEAGTVRYDVADVVLAEVLRNCEVLVALQVRAKGLQFTHDIASDDVLVRADAEKLQQIVLNLLANAIKFTDSGGSIVLASSSNGDEIAVSVTDTGRGIPALHLRRIFEPFVQIDTRLTRTQEGVGLGLAISRDLARGMGGDLTARSTDGKGSTFILTIPAVK